MAQAAPTEATQTLSPEQLATLTQTFRQEQQALAQSFSSLAQAGATFDQFQAWQTQNSSLLLDQKQMAQEISDGQPIHPIDYITQIEIPEDASQTMIDFLKARAGLYNLRAQLHNQEMQISGAVDDKQEEITFQKQNAPALQAQAQRAQILGQESASRPLSIPSAFAIPAGFSPQMTSFLKLRNECMHDQFALVNQLVTATPTQRDAALLQWTQQNEARLTQLQQMAKNLTQSNEN